MKIEKVTPFLVGARPSSDGWSQGQITLFVKLETTDGLVGWGEAYALGPNLNDGMHEENRARTVAAAARALQLAVTLRDRMLATALVAPRRNVCMQMAGTSLHLITMPRDSPR